MKTKVVMILVSLVILLPSFGLAQGGWITLPAQAFQAASSNYEWGTVIVSGVESYLQSMGTGSPEFVAPVYFPQEADGLSVRQMNATVRDSDSVESIKVQLFRMNRYSGVTHTVFSVSSGYIEAPGHTVLTDKNGSYRLIDSQKYAWFVWVEFAMVPTPAHKLRLYSVRIQYQ